MHQALLPEGHASLDEIVGLETPAHRGPASKLQQQITKIALLPRAKQKFIIEMLDALIHQQQMTPAASNDARKT